jgi:phosphoribosylamine---glycine ligase
MRFLGIGDYCDLAALYMRLLKEGHEVKVFIGNPLCHGTLAGLVERTTDWRSELDWIRGSDDLGIILFENVADDRGELQDVLRAQGFAVVGGSAYGDRLENDRGYAQRVLGEAGLRIGEFWEFSNRTAALEFLAARPGRYVLKFNGPTGAIDNYVGQLKDGRDVQVYLRRLTRVDEYPSLILMEYIIRRRNGGWRLF